MAVTNWDCIHTNKKYDVVKDWTPPNTQVQATFRREGVYEGMTGPGTTRIDAVLFNKAATAVVTDVKYSWADAHGFDHVPISITISLAQYDQMYQTLTRPQ